MGVIEQITDRVERMLARRLQQDRNKPNYEALIRIFAAQFQAIDDAAWQLQSFVARNISTATGDLLDKFGKIVGEPRGTSVSDTEYRFRIRARIRANRSTGTPPDLFSVFRALLGPDTGRIVYEPGYPAGFTLRIEDYSMGATLVPVFADFLHDAKAAGVYGVLEYNVGDPEDALRCAVATWFAGASLAGATTLTVASTDGFPSSGSLVLDEGLAAEETVTYSGVTSSSFTGVSATANNHEARAIVAWADSPGLGFGAGNIGGARSS